MSHSTAQEGTAVGALEDRALAWTMLPVGVIMFLTGAHSVLELLPMLELLAAMPLLYAVPALNALIELAFGTGLLVAALALLSVARTGTVDALLRGLRALCVVYVVKALLLLLAVAAPIFVLSGLPFIM